MVDRHKTGRYSRAKGKRGELEFVRWLKAHGVDDARRTAQVCGSSGEAADVVGLPLIHIEVKNVARLNLRSAVEQAVRDAGAHNEKTGEALLPVVVHKIPRRGWYVTMTAEDWWKLYETAAGDGRIAQNGA
nr:MAG TPA: HOLLIDAY JUNCTION RESOLVASE HOMOLOGOUS RECOMBINATION [Bacteriophage sp.]